MFQSFTATTTPEQGPPRLAALRARLQAQGLDGVIVPRADAHQGEYVAACDERLAWLTGFTGSAGFVIVLADCAGLFVDGRYRVQARLQCAPDFTPVHWPETRPADWLRKTLPGPAVIGFDPWLHTPGEIETLAKGLEGSAITLQRIANPVDPLWTDRPARPAAPVHAHPETLAGESAASKCARLAETLRTAGQSAAVLTLPDSIAWLLNIRGRDLPRLPVAQAFAILHAGGHVSLFLDPARLTDDAAQALAACVTLRPPEAFEPALRTLEGPVRLDRATAPQRIADILTEAAITIAGGDDPCILPKARKTAAELDGARAAHLRDGAAMAEFLAWLDARAEALCADSEGAPVSEIDVVRQLEACRTATNQLQDISFDTIAGAGPHGAIVHYRVTEGSNRALRPGELLLVDSGGQYPDGTTDITRTIAVGPPGAAETDAFTRVLKGMIAMSRARFPRGVAGAHLDALARFPLWLAGQDYDHGTGHGVGAFLSVHEGPQRLSRISQVPLEPGMILSNEPGYYREGAFGIRIENLIAVQAAPPLDGADDRDMLAFETLTLAPIDRRLIRTDMLDTGERAWLDAYHARTRDALAPLVSTEIRAWLEAATAPL
ncbi:MAG: aminopeptidase P family protein [Rhodobacteraceae bacterium]|nr:aminopeptidase P family protein [Paracoccaceae bacterium]